MNSVKTADEYKQPEILSTTVQGTQPAESKKNSQKKKIIGKEGKET